MEIRRTALGEGHPDYATSLNNLAGLYHAMGRHAEAEPLYKQAMEIRRTALGERASRLRHLAEQPGGAVPAMGRHAEAEPLYQAGDGDSPHGPGRGASRLRRLAEQPGGAVPRDGPARRRPSRSTSKAMEIRRTALGEGIPTTPPR